MRPFTVLIGIILGSAASITFGLGAVLVVFFVLKGEHPDLALEMPQLLVSAGAFGLLTAASAGSFFALARERRWAGWAHIGTLLCLAAVVLLYWPKRT